MALYKYIFRHDTNTREPVTSLTLYPAPEGRQEQPVEPKEGEPVYYYNYLEAASPAEAWKKAIEYTDVYMDHGGRPNASYRMAYDYDNSFSPFGPRQSMVIQLVPGVTYEFLNKPEVRRTKKLNKFRALSLFGYVNGGTQYGTWQKALNVAAAAYERMGV